MADDTQHRISAEGADPLLFAGVNDANLQELQRTLGIRITFRGDPGAIVDAQNPTTPDGINLEGASYVVIEN